MIIHIKILVFSFISKFNLNGLEEWCHAEKFGGKLMNEEMLFDMVVKLFGVKSNSY